MVYENLLGFWASELFFLESQQFGPNLETGRERKKFNNMHKKTDIRNEIMHAQH